MTMTNAGLIGIGTTAPSNFVHILGAGTPQAGSSDMNELVIQTSNISGATAGITIISGNAGYGGISFGDTDDSNAGQFWYDHSDNEFKLQTTVAGNDVMLRLLSLASANARMYFENNDGDIGGLFFSTNSCALGLRLYDAGTATSISNGTFARYNSSGFAYNFDCAGNTASDKFVITSDDAGSSDTDILFKNTDSTVTATHTLLMLEYTNEDLDSLSTGAGRWVQFNDSTGARGGIYWDASSNVMVYSNSSDARLKDDLKDFNGLDLVNSVGVYDFKWKSSGNRSYGFLAQEFYKNVYNKEFPEDHPETLQMDYGKMTPFLWKAVQELSKRVEELEKQ